MRLLILDFDGTIGDTKPIITNTFRATLREMGLPDASPEDIANTIGLPLAKAFSLLLSADKDKAEACARTYRRIFDENNRPGTVPVFPHVIETIKTLRQTRGTTITIASSRGHKSLEAFLKEMQLDADVSYVLGVEDVENAKPNPEAVLKTMDHFGIPAEETLVVGDTRFDIQMGNAAHAHTCGVTYGNGTRQELAEAKAEHIVDAFDAIKDISL